MRGTDAAHTRTRAYLQWPVLGLPRPAAKAAARHLQRRGHSLVRRTRPRKEPHLPPAVATDNGIHRLRRRATTNAVSQRKKFYTPTITAAPLAALSHPSRLGPARSFSLSFPVVYPAARARPLVRSPPTGSLARLHSPLAAAASKRELATSLAQRLAGRLQSSARPSHPARSGKPPP